MALFFVVDTVYSSKPANSVLWLGPDMWFSVFSCSLLFIDSQ